MRKVQPTATYTGTTDEVFRHREDIPDGAILVLRVYEPEPQAEPDSNNEPSLFERYSHLFGTATELPPDLAEHSEQYLTDTGFGVTKSEWKL